MTKNRLLIFGNSYIDFIMKVKRAPERGETVLSNLDHSLQPGGLGLISALTASKYGTDVIFSTHIGEDENGDKLLKVLNNNGVDTRFIKVDKRKATGLNAVTIEDKTKYRTVSYPAANTSMSYDDIEAAFMSYPDAVLLNFDLKEDFLLDTIKYANDANVPVFLSCGSEFINYDIQDYSPIEVFLPNREAVYRITGIDPVDATSALHACVKIIGKIKTKYIVIKLGDRGAFAFDGVYSEIIPACEVDVLDTTMAGTIFSSALAHSYLQSKDIVSSAKFANAVASLSTAVEGAFYAIPDLDNVMKALKNL